MSPRTSWESLLTLTMRPCTRCLTAPPRPTMWRSWATYSPRAPSMPRSRSCAWRFARPRWPRPRSATARASCTPPASFTRAGHETGRFLQLLHDGPGDVEIPGGVDGADSFTTLKNAEAIGDLETLRELGLPAERVRLQGDDPVAALRGLTARIKGLSGWARAPAWRPSHSDHARPGAGSEEATE